MRAQRECRPPPGTEHKREAIARASQSDSPLAGKLNADRYTVTDEDVLKRLYGLK